MRRGTRIAVSIAAGLAIPALFATAFINPYLPVLISLGGTLTFVLVTACVRIGLATYRALGD